MNSSDTTEIKRIPILDVASKLGIKVRGKKAMCFENHDTKTPSLNFMPDTNYWKCYGACGKHGDAIQLVMDVEKLDFQSALQWFSLNFNVTAHNVRVSRKVHLKTSKLRRSLSVKNKATSVADSEIYQWLITKCGRVSTEEGRQYLDQHGIPEGVAERFNLRQLTNPIRALHELKKKWGTDRVYQSGLVIGDPQSRERLIWSSNAILFPFFNAGKVVYIQGRLLQGRTKFMGPVYVDKPLFNIDRFNSLTKGSRIHLCEGIPDAIALEAQGLAAVAVLGATSFRADWVDLFLNYDVYLMPDGDRGGQQFWLTTSKMFAERGKPVHRVELPKGKDVADVLAAMREGTV